MNMSVTHSIKRKIPMVNFAYALAHLHATSEYSEEVVRVSSRKSI